MAVDTKGNIFVKVAVVNGITFVRKFSPYSDDAEWGNLEFYSIYAGEVITRIELGETSLTEWLAYARYGSRQSMSELLTLGKLKVQTRERIETLAGLTHGL